MNNRPKKASAAAQRDQMIVLVSKAYIVLNGMESPPPEVVEALEYLDQACKVVR